MSRIGNTSVEAWHCYSDIGKPVCLVGQGDDGGLELVVYSNKKGTIKGVVARLRDGGEYPLVGVIGKVPKKALAN